MKTILFAVGKRAVQDQVSFGLTLVVHLGEETIKYIVIKPNNVCILSYELWQTGV